MKLINNEKEVTAIRVSFNEEFVFYVVSCCQIFYDEVDNSITFYKDGRGVLKINDRRLLITHCPWCGTKIDSFNIQSL